MDGFQPSGPLLGFTSASSAPTSVQPSPLDGTQTPYVRITNVDATNDAVVGWGVDDTTAKLNAAAAANVRKCVYVVRGTSVIVNAGSSQYFSGIAVASTAVIKVQAVVLR